jgi:transposase InsO family protein
VAIDDHARISFAAIHANEKYAAVAFLHSMRPCYAGLGVRVASRPTTGAASGPRSLLRPGNALGVQRKFIRPYRPQANGKAERFIQYDCASGPLGGHTITQLS